MEKKMKKPEVGIIICNSGASNTGSITGIAAFKVIEKIGGNNKVGICSLPALANKVPRQSTLVQQIKHLIVVDGCHQQCAKKIIDEVGINYDRYINLEKDLGIKKKGPFTSLEYSDNEIKKVSSYIFEKIDEILNSSAKDKEKVMEKTKINH